MVRVLGVWVKVGVGVRVSVVRGHLGADGPLHLVYEDVGDLAW